MTAAQTPIVSMDQMQNVKFHGVVLRLTSAARPEQYDAYIGGEKVGYFRMRWNHFRVQYLLCLSEVDVVYHSETKGFGEFDKEERYTHLSAGCKALFKRHMGTDL